MTETKCKCGANINPDANFCDICGKPQLAVWSRDEENFAAYLSSELINQASERDFLVMHGNKALILEDGRLVQIAESGRHTTQEGGFLNTPFTKKKNISVVLMDAGDVHLDFRIGDVKTKDGLFVNIGFEISLRLEDPNSFFVNVMKEQTVFKIHGLRRLLFGEIQNAMQEGIGNYNFDDLNAGLATKNEIASRMEAHLRQTFGRSGLGFGQVGAISISQEKLDATAKQAAETEMEARGIETAAIGTKRVGKAKLSVDEVERSLEEEKIKGDLKEAEILKKRLEVYGELRKVDVEKIKSEENFRKFKMEIDRDRVLDNAEWKSFEDEILWKEEDRKRDRSFLIRKIDLQQEHDLKRLELVNRKDLTMEERRRDMEIIEYDFKVDQARAEAKVAADNVAKIGEKETEIQTKLKDLDLEKARITQAVELEKEKEKAKHEFKKLEIEGKRLKSELGLSNLERIKAIKRKDKAEDIAIELEKDQKKLEMRIKEDDAVFQREKEKMKAMAELSIEQLIAVSEESQAAILGDLAQSQTLKGMTPDEIMAMKDPVAFGKAIEERAKSAQSEELKNIYERMLDQNQATLEKVAQAHRESADRAERMHKESVKAMSGQIQGVVQAERDAADRVERISDRSMDKMGDVAGTRARSGQGGEGYSSDQKVLVCEGCKQEVKTDRNFCQNCGTKLY